MHIKNISNNEKGSITLFVLIAILFFLISTLFVFFYSNITKSSQIKQVEKIQEEYNPTFEMMEKEYKTVIKD